MEKKQKITMDELANFCIECAEEKKAGNVLKIKLSAENSVADYLVIATADSEPQANAIEGFIARQIRDVYEIRPLSVSGSASSGWILIDFAGVVVHVMTEEARSRYNLEALWGENSKNEIAEKLNELSSKDF